MARQVQKTLARPYADSQGRRWIHLGSGFVVLIDTLRTVTPATTADGDRLFEGDNMCCLCGAEEWQPGMPFTPRGGVLGTYSAHAGRRLCALHCEDLVQADAEITRRKSPAANAQKLVSGSVGSMEVATREDANLMSWKYDRGLMSSIQRAEPERPTSDYLAWAIRRETLAAEEKRRWHLEERRKAYATREGDVNQAMYDAESPGLADYAILEHARKLDAAIARVKPKVEEGPAYIDKNWPADSEYEGQV